MHTFFLGTILLWNQWKTQKVLWKFGEYDSRKIGVPSEYFKPNKTEKKMCLTIKLWTFYKMMQTNFVSKQFIQTKHYEIVRWFSDLALMLQCFIMINSKQIPYFPLNIEYYYNILNAKQQYNERMNLHNHDNRKTR